jgi:hypothetical protein
MKMELNKTILIKKLNKYIIYYTSQMIFNYINSLKVEESDEIIEDVYNSVFNSSIHHRFKNKNIINKVI